MDQNRDLVKRYQEGDIFAAEELLKRNEKFIIKIAHGHYKAMNSDLRYVDLMQEGRMGLLEAAKRMDLTRETSFLTYAEYWIRQYMTRANNWQGHTIRVPDNIMTELKKLIKWDSEYDYLPWQEREKAIAEKMNYPVYRISTFYEIAKMLGLESLDREIEEDCVLGDLVEYPCVPDISKDVVKETLRDTLEEIMDKVLTERERDIVKRRCGFYTMGDPETLEEVGKAYGLTRERVRQMERKALCKMRHPKYARQIKDYLTD